MGVERMSKAPLMRESLMDKQVLAATGDGDELRILPDVNIVTIGGSILDRGKSALLPLLEELVRCRREHKIVLGVGGGAGTRQPITSRPTWGSRSGDWRWSPGR